MDVSYPWTFRTRTIRTQQHFNDKISIQEDLRCFSETSKTFSSKWGLTKHCLYTTGKNDVRRGLKVPSSDNLYNRTNTRISLKSIHIQTSVSFPLFSRGRRSISTLNHSYIEVRSGFSFGWFRFGFRVPVQALTFTVLNMNSILFATK